jgi:WD40 repeat protein
MKINTFTGHNDSVNVVSWSPFNPLQFASGSSDRKIVIWDIERLKLNTNDKQGN